MKRGFLTSALIILCLLSTVIALSWYLSQGHSSMWTLRWGDTYGLGTFKHGQLLLAINSDPDRLWPGQGWGWGGMHWGLGGAPGLSLADLTTHAVGPFGWGGSGVFEPRVRNIICLVVPLWFPLSITLTAAMLCLFRLYRSRIAPGHCPTCGYDLRGLRREDARCPECGTPATPPAMN